MKKNIITLVSAIMFISSQAFAFEGFSIGATYSSMDFSTTGTETANGAITAGEVGATSTNTTTKTGSGDVGSVFAEYTFSQGSTIGVEYIDGSTEIGKASRSQTAETDGGNSGTVTASASIADPTTFYVEPTYMLNEKFGVYVKGGATRVTVQPKEVADAGSLVTSTYGNKDVWGVMTGIGAKAYWNNIFFKAEYVERDFATYSFKSTAGDKNTIVADIDTEETRFSIGYNF